MTIEPTLFDSAAEAWRCTVGCLELIVVTGFGPRILSLRFEGSPNLLYQDTTDFRVGAWRLYGGHRFTVAPESATSYLPDNAPCDVRIEDDRMVIFVPSPDGLGRSLEIQATPDHLGFVLRHGLRNLGSSPWHGAVWAITCVPATGKFVVSQTSGPPRFWTVSGQRYADASSWQWRNVDGQFLIEPTGEKGKVGLNCPDSLLAWLGPQETLVIQGPARDAQATYPDAGCNVEVFTCADYLELETLGPLTTLLPDQELTHEQYWQVIPAARTPKTWRTLVDRIAPCLRRPTDLLTH